MRDSENRAGGTLVFPPASCTAFVAGIKIGVKVGVEADSR
ncbi:hypothetical protein GCM10010185_37190 [Saccharothrix coeruleofusca]|uniref:DUF397 domain-containing protein n=1 Tax=Saccharothrix coeruleofusca TaxID=33919 RepID=A0A918APX6_9PSEU|nr:hypothetical protein GCM10010185_37190 [Saccharothrix coeruleofusca]